MSIDIMNRLWWRSDLPTMEKFIAIALADAAGDEGACWPAVATIAEKCTCSERTVQNAIKGLIGKQLLRRIERRDRSSYYIFNVANLPNIDRPKRFKERGLHEDLTGESPAPDLFGTGASDDMTGESGSMTGESGSMTGESPAPRTPIEPSIEPSLSDSGDFKSPVVVSTGEISTELAAPSLSKFVEGAWADLKMRHDGIAAVRKIDDGLKHTIELRGKQHANEGENGFDVWREFFARVDASLFLQGRAPPGRDRDQPFKLSLGWAMKAANFREILNGKYDTTRAPTSHDHRGERLAPADQAFGQAVRDFRQSRGGGTQGRGRGADHG